LIDKRAPGLDLARAGQNESHEKKARNACSFFGVGEKSFGVGFFLIGGEPLDFSGRRRKR
jgi:hypothetical protein